MGKQSVLFIVPPVIPLDEMKRTDIPTMQWATNCSIPMGILSLAAYAGKYADVDFKILDYNVEIARNKRSSLEWDSFVTEQLLKLELKRRPDIVGISAIFNSNAGYLQSIAATAKGIWPDAITIAGGGLPTNMYSDVLDFAPALDAVAIGEGEKPLLGLISAVDKTAYLNNASGWMTKARLKSGMPPTMDLVSELDDIPFLRYDLIEFEEYQKFNRYHGDKKKNVSAVSIMTSRGCPYLCNFCSSHSVHGRKIRYHSSERVLGDIKTLKEKYGINVLLVEDDNFLVNKKNAIRILDEISQLDMIIEFPNGLSIMHVNEEVVDALKRAGLRMATLAVESGSERVLNEIIHKPYKKLSTVTEAVGLLRRKGIYIRAFFIIGFPGETKEEIMESVQFMKSTGFNWVAIMIASPIAGSELYEQCRDNKLLVTDNIEDFHYGKCSIKLSHSTPEELERLRYLINLEVNFVNNYDLLNGQPEIALTGFQDVLSRVSNHAFAFYFASLCYKMMGNLQKEKEYLENYRELVSSSEQWAGYARHFNLPLEEVHK